MKAYVFATVVAGKAADVSAAFRAIPGVRSADICWGLPDIIAAVEVPEGRALQDLVLHRMQRTPGVNSTDTHIVVE